MILDRLFRLLPAALIAAALAAPAAAAPVQTGHIEAQLVAQDAAAVPGSTVYVGLRQKIKPGWHTYWRNPGDAGEATKLAWTLPPGWSAGDIVWPTPQRKRVGPLLDYAYDGEVLLPVPISVPADARPGATATLAVVASFLVCEQICIPEEASLTLVLPVVAGVPGPDRQWGAAMAKALAQAPKPAGLKASFQRDATGVRLAVTGAPLVGADMADAYFFPYSGKVIDHAAVQAVERGPEGLTLTLAPGFDFTQGTAPTELAGVLALKGAAYEVTATAGPPAAAAAGLGPPPAAAEGRIGLPLALAFAFLGGLILNLMPCVFPVLSMKAASLAAHAHDTRRARRQGLAFLAGVVATFLSLAGLLIAVRAGGAAVGWGFQLQSPLVVALLALTMLLVALNLSGVFEVGTSIQGVGAGASARDGAAGAFFTGALAVVVAAPCTAPFMAGALGFALTQPPLLSLAVFLALALGFAAPFVALAFAPGLLARLPRPGPWMAVLKTGLAFPMYAAAAWLLWVFAQQAGAIGLAQLLAAAVLTALAAWLFGGFQARRAIGRPGAAWLAPAGLALAGALVLVGLGAVAPAAPAAAGQPSAAAALPTEAWSPERVAALQAEGRPVLVDFTAAWCVTCQVNEKVALSGAGVAQAFQTHRAVLLRADWTNRDARIAAALAEHGRAGVPLYLLYPAGGGAPTILPQLLTEGLVIAAVETAAAD